MSSLGSWPESRKSPDIHSFWPYSKPLADRLLEPGVVVPLALLAVAVLCNSNQARAIASPALVQRLWDALVALIPAGLLFAIDDWLHPFPLPRSMLHLRPTSHAAKSEALKRILGRGPAGSGIAGSVAYASGVGMSKLAMRRRNPHQPAGLGNMSNSCYQNSILQGLASLKPFREYLAHVTAEAEHGLLRVYATEALAGLVRQLYGTEGNGTTIWTPPVLKSMSTLQQQDAQEYFSRLLNEVDEEIQKALKSTHGRASLEADAPRDDSAASQHSDDSGYHSMASSSKQLFERTSSFRNPLEGLLGQRVACTACGSSSGLRLDSFHCLTLNPDVGYRESSLRTLLDGYTEIEQIEGVICGSCTLLKCRDKISGIVNVLRSRGIREDGPLKAALGRLAAVEAAIEIDDFEEKTLTERCNIGPKLMVQSTKTKQVGIARPPASIAFHINRSMYNEFTGHTVKNLAPVRFPKVLNLGPWCIGSAASLVPDAGGDVDSASSGSANEEQWQLPPQLPMVAGSQQKSNLAGPYYELRAVITHYGLHENGHYVCYRKHPPSRRMAEEEDENPDSEDGLANLASEDDQDGPQGSPNEETPLLAKDPSARAGSNQRGGEEETDAEEEAQWWRLSDQDVTRVDEAVVLGQGGVFMLFYDRIDPNSVLVSRSEDERWTDEAAHDNMPTGHDDPDLSLPAKEGSAAGERANPDNSGNPMDSLADQDQDLPASSDTIQSRNFSPNPSACLLACLLPLSPVAKESSTAESTVHEPADLSAPLDGELQVASDGNASSIEERASGRAVGSLVQPLAGSGTEGESIAAASVPLPSSDDDDDDI